MMKKRSKLLAIMLVFAFALTGVAYAYWTDSLEVQGTVNTGNIDVQFAEAWTNDEGVDPNLIASKGDISVQGFLVCWKCWNWKWNCKCEDEDEDEDNDNETQDPNDVAQTKVRITKRNSDGLDSHEINKSLLVVKTLNAYPGYESEVFYQLVNKGTVPVKITDIDVKVKDDDEGLSQFIEVNHQEDVVGKVIYPESRLSDEEKAENVFSFTQKVNEGLGNAGMKKVFEYEIELDFVQWNIDPEEAR